MSVPAPPLSSRRVRTRFAPSPTGYLHVGALRTALFSWLLARHRGGDFLLRIEDTDQKRIVPGALADIIASLRALGLDYDEGPDRASVAVLDRSKYGDVPDALLPDEGGDAGPYFQSQRLARYRQIAEQLIAENKAYYAFDTPEELDAKRAAAQAQNRPYLYDRRYRDFGPDEAQARVARGEPHVVRFAVPLEGIIRTEDALRGVTDWDAATQDDFIIIKSDGFAPYHLSAMVDDHDMQISHVLRATEWLSSSPKHFCIFQALGWEPPIFVHVAGVNGPDNKKLSKRTGAKGVFEFLNEGFLPEALFNYLALVGWSPGDDTEIMDQNEIIRRFDLDGLARSPAIFDLDKLTWMNGVYIRQMPPPELARRVLPFLAQAGHVGPDPDQAARDYVSGVLLLEQERLKRLDEAPALTDFFWGDLPAYQPKSVQKWLQREPEATQDFLRDLHAALAALPAWVDEAIEAATRAVGERHGRERGELTHPIRVAVTGREVGPGLFETMAVLGKQRVLGRLQHARELAGAEQIRD